MPPIVFTLLKALFLLLLYVFVARAVRWVYRDVAQTAPATNAPRPAPKVGARVAARPQGRGPGRRKSRIQPGQLVVHIAEGRPQVIALSNGTEVTFGRHGTTVPLEDAYVSERHARVYQQDNQWLLVDLGSTNGTFLNQVKVTSPTPIAAGDQLALGKTIVEVRK